MMGGMKTDKEILTLAYLFLSEEVPYKAAKIITKGMKDGFVKETSQHLDLLGQIWQMSHETEKALPVMERAAVADSGEIYQRLWQFTFKC